MKQYLLTVVLVIITSTVTAVAVVGVMGAGDRNADYSRDEKRAHSGGLRKSVAALTRRSVNVVHELRRQRQRLASLESEARAGDSAITVESEDVSEREDEPTSQTADFMLNYLVNRVFVEKRDLDWATETERALIDAVEASFPDVMTMSAKCGSTTCLVESSYPSQRDAHLFVSNMSEHLPSFDEAHYIIEKNEEGEPSVMLALVRKGASQTLRTELGLE